VIKILLTGRSGQIGWELQRTLTPLGKLTVLSHQEMNLADPEDIRRVMREHRPDVVVNAAAYTEVEKAEEEPTLAMAVNGTAPGILAEEAKQSGALLVHYSTDYVFDGEKGSPYVETDIPHPLNVYGESKLAGEVAIQQAAEAYLILRTSWVYSLRLQSGFVKKVLSWARQNETLRVVQDQTGCPTWARMLAETTALLIAKSGDRPVDYFKLNHGIYHVAGKGSASRYEWAQAILANDSQRNEHRISRLEPAQSAEFPAAAARPEYSVLDCTQFENTFGLCIPNWKESLVLAMGE